MMRFAFAGLAMLALAGVAAAEEDHGPALVDLFAKTCARRPALPSEIERLASGLGFVSEGGPILAEMERGPRVDILDMSARREPPRRASIGIVYNSRKRLKALGADDTTVGRNSAAYCAVVRYKRRRPKPPRMPPKRSDSTNRTMKTKNTIFAIPAAAPAMPPNPSAAAISAMISRVMTAPSMMPFSLVSQIERPDGARVPSDMADEWPSE